LLQIPVGRATLGRIINVIGEPIDEQGPISKHFLLELFKALQLSRIALCLWASSSSCSQLLMVSCFPQFWQGSQLCFNVWSCFLLMIVTILAGTNDTLPIHREAPTFAEQSTEQEVLVTGIKVCIEKSTHASRSNCSIESAAFLLVAMYPYLTVAFCVARKGCFFLAQCIYCIEKLFLAGAMGLYVGERDLHDSNLAHVGESFDVPGRGSAGSISERRQDWSLWRCWCRQNGAYYGTDQQCGQGSW
jgi:hypothetical protein